MEQAIGDWILYYELRRREGITSATGRQSYIAMARVTSVVPDEQQPDHYYAYLSDYLEFDAPVPFRQDGGYFESILVKADGSTNKGRIRQGSAQHPAIRVQPGRQIRVPARGDLRPHATYLRWHREQRFKG